jgi:hypothetical protein
MLAMIIGAVVAFIFVGVPLAIIGLFIVSILDRRRSAPGDLAKPTTASESQVSTGSKNIQALGARFRASPPHASQPVAARARLNAAAKHAGPSGEFLDAPREDCACHR